MHLQFKFFSNAVVFFVFDFITYGFKNRRTLRFFHCVVVFFILFILRTTIVFDRRKLLYVFL